MSNLFKGKDKIILNDMCFFGHHGVFDSEKESGQPFIVDVIIEADLSLARLLDNVEYTVNYAVVYDIIQKVVTEERYDLIERLADRIADTIIDNFVQCEKVQVRVRKPQSPIEGYTVTGPAVEIEKKKGKNATAYIAIGSNLGDSVYTLKTAVKMLDEVKGVKVKQVSSLYLTKPVGYLDQPDFVNGAIKINTSLSPKNLLVFTQKIENELGRVRTIKNGARTIDLDILLFGDRKISTERLIVPHERMFERAFALVPLCDLLDDGPAREQLMEIAMNCDDYKDLQPLEVGDLWYKKE